MRFNNYINAPIARWKDELYNLPLNMNTFYAMWGVKTPAEAVAQIAKQRRNSGISDPKNLEEQAISLVGEDIYRKLIKGYTEKQWGRDCRQLPPFIIKRLPVRLTFNNNYFNDLYQGIPEEGYTALVAKMLEGTDVHLGIDYLEHRDELDSLAEKIVYTGAIDAFYDYRFGPLAYRSLRFETEVLALENYQGCAVVNYTEREIPYTRIIDISILFSVNSLKRSSAVNIPLSGNPETSRIIPSMTNKMRPCLPNIVHWLTPNLVPYSVDVLVPTSIMTWIKS